MAPHRHRNPSRRLTGDGATATAAQQKHRIRLRAPANDNQRPASRHRAIVAAATGLLLAVTLLLAALLR